MIVEYSYKMFVICANRKCGILLLVAASIHLIKNMCSDYMYIECPATDSYLSPDAPEYVKISIHQRRNKTRCHHPPRFISDCPEKIALDVLPRACPIHEHDIRHITRHLRGLLRSSEHVGFKVPDRAV